MKKINVNGAYMYQYPILNFDVSQQIKLMVDAVVGELKGYDCIQLVCTGTSGLYIATQMFMLDPKLFRIYYVRKDNDAAHSGKFIHKQKQPSGAFLFVDDFICTGKTFQRVADDLYIHSRNLIKYVMTLGGVSDRGYGQDAFLNVKLEFKGS